MMDATQALSEKELIEYDEQNNQLYSITMVLAKCIDVRHLTLLPEAIERLKAFFASQKRFYAEFHHRPLRILHSILISRMFYNKTFKSPFYEYDLNRLIAYAQTEEEYKKVMEILVDGIERSITQES
jgi:hypothetical protein